MIYTDEQKTEQIFMYIYMLHFPRITAYLFSHHVVATFFFYTNVHFITVTDTGDIVVIIVLL